MKYIDQNEIYKATNQGRKVFEYYFPDYDFGNPKAKTKIRDEKTPSTVITFYQGLWRCTDFGNQGEVNSLPAVPFIMWRESLIYIDALCFIQDVIIKKEVSVSEFFRPEYKAKYSWREMKKNDYKGEYKFTYKKKPTAIDLASIGRYVNADELKKYYGKSVQKYEYCGHSKKLKRDVVHIFESTDTYPIFVFEYDNFKKLYKPYELNKQYRFSYVGTKPANYIYGLDQIRDAENDFIVSDNEGETENVSNAPKHKPNAIVKDLFKCSGESDALNMASLGFNVYWLNSESAIMDYESFSTVDELCENHYQLMDMDETGQQVALKFALKHMNLFTVYLPDWLKLKRDWRGNKCKDIKDFINIAGNDINITQDKVNQLKRVAMPIKFWNKKYNEKNKETNYNINLEYYYHFLKAHGFYTMDSKYHRKAGYCYARVNGKIVDLIHPDDIKKLVKRFTKEWVRSKGLHDEIAILNKLNSSNQISESNLQELAEFNPNFVNCDKNTEYLHFKNGSLKITKDEIKKVKHTEIPNYILGKLEINTEILSHYKKLNITQVKKPAIEVIGTTEYQALLDKKQALQDKKQDTSTIEAREKVNIELAKFSDLDKYEIKINDEDFIFTRFLKDLSYLHWRKKKEKGQELTPTEIKEQNLCLANLLFVFGWNIAEYKESDRPWISITQDMKISQVGQSSGRSGKGVFMKAFANVRNSFYVGGRRKDITDKTEFLYDGYTIFHNNIEIDDLYEYADFNFFYTQSTGKREVNSKFISKQVLDYKDSGKLAISTNFELMNTDASTLARLLNSGISDYYHEKTSYNEYQETRTPGTQFGKQLYDDFTEEEWIKFFNLAAYAIQLQMRFFKIQPPMANLEKRQLRRDMSKGLGRDEEFWIWVNTYFVVVPETFQDEFCPGNQGYFNRYVKREYAFENFKGTLTKLQSTKYRATQFKKSLQSFCTYFGYELNPLHLCSNEQNKKLRRITKTVDNENSEYFFISTTSLLQGDSRNAPSDDLPF